MTDVKPGVGGIRLLPEPLEGRLPRDPERSTDHGPRVTCGSSLGDRLPQGGLSEHEVSLRLDDPSEAGGIGSRMGFRVNV